LGDGTQATRLLPVKVPIDSVASVAGGGFHTLAVRKDGSLWAWGYNPNGQLGDGSRIDRHFPVRILGIWDVYMASGGVAHSVAVRNDGSVWAWGWNATQQVGSADLSDKLTPSPVQCSADAACPRGSGSQLGRISRVGAGGFHSTALSVDGKVWSWGLNNLGQLGNGGSADSARAVVARDATLSDISAGFVHSLGG
jgi:alpha-tubulin suppressor-like RCC1 family protein